jgi:TRAP-type C4-dicarboxylate transport system permease large subunit
VRGYRRIRLVYFKENALFGGRQHYIQGIRSVTWKALPALVTPFFFFLQLGGLYSGFVTCTEAGALRALCDYKFFVSYKTEV